MSLARLLLRNPCMQTRTMASTASPPLHVLVSGAGIAGPVLAYWLKQANIKCTVAERAPQLRKEGQTVDINNEARDVVKLMGVDEQIRARVTNEKGTRFVGLRGQTTAEFPFSQDGVSLTNELEIVRGELAMVLYEHAKDAAEWLFDHTIETVRDEPDGVYVTFEDRPGEHRYDLLVISEGLISRTRAKAFDEGLHDAVSGFNLYTAIWSFPRSDAHGDDDWWHWYWLPGRRMVQLRPDGLGRVRASLIVYDETNKTRLLATSKVGQDEQKRYFADLFRDAGWKVPRLLEGLQGADDLYVQEFAQLKRDSWSKGRIALLGDSAYCPSPLSGMGTSAAIVGAYVLAAELARHAGARDHTAALRGYEDHMRPWVEQIQTLPPGFPGLLTQRSTFAISLLHAFAGTLSFLERFRLVSGFFKLLPEGANASIKLPSQDVFSITHHQSEKHL